jgi:hypothetical protein
MSWARVKEFRAGITVRILERLDDDLQTCS